MPLRDTWSFVPRLTNQATGRPTLGSTAWAGDNPPFGATFTVHVPDVPQTASEERRESERARREAGDDVAFPGYDALRAERNDGSPMVRVRVSDASGRPIRWVQVPAREGVHRVTWDLRHPRSGPGQLRRPGLPPSVGHRSDGPARGSGHVYGPAGPGRGWCRHGDRSRPIVRGARGPDHTRGYGPRGRRGVPPPCGRSPPAHLDRQLGARPGIGARPIHAGRVGADSRGRPRPPRSGWTSSPEGLPTSATS